MNRPGLLLAALLLASLAGAAPSVLTWGPLTVTVTPRPEGSDEAPAQAVVRSGSRTVLTVTDWDVTAQLQPLRPGGLPELVLTGYSGGAHCCFTHYVFTQDTGRVENLGVFAAGDDEGRWVDLNGDGTREFVWGSNALTYYDWSFAESPFVLTVLGWDGVRLADRTRAYAYVPGQAATRELKAVQGGLAAGQGVDQLKPRLAGYYANMVLAGRGAEAERVMAAQIFPRLPGMREWFTHHRADLINATYAQPEGRLRAVNRAAYPVRDPQQP